MSIKRLLITGLWLGFVMPVITMSGLIYAQPLGLQTAGVGEGYVFSSVAYQEWHSELRFHKQTGAIHFKNLPTEKLSSEWFNISLNNAYSYRAGPHFYIVGYAHVDRRRLNQSMRQSPWRLKLSRSVYTAGSRVVLDRQKMILSATVGLKFRGQQTRELTVKDRETRITSEKGSLLLPHHSFGLGWKFPTTTLLWRVSFGESGSRTFQGSSSDLDKQYVMDQPLLGSSATTDEEARFPWHSGVHVLMDYNSEFQFAVSVDYQADPHAYYGYWSHVTDESGRRRSPSLDRHKGQWQFRGGFRYFALPDLSISLSGGYDTPGYTESRFASLELDNLGGFEAGFDVEFMPRVSFRMTVGITTQYPIQLKQTYDHLDGEVLDHQSIPISSVSSAILSQNTYALLLSLAYIPQPSEELEH